MENGEGGYFNNSDIIEDKNGYKGEVINKSKVQELVNQTRQDTLLQVLPKKESIPWLNIKTPEMATMAEEIAEESEKYGMNICIEKIKNKAKSLWGLKI